MKELEYPFDSGYIINKKKSIKKALLADGSKRTKKKSPFSAVPQRRIS